MGVLSVLRRKPEIEIGGTVAPGFEPVLETFRANFRERGEIGAALHVTRDGETVVDLWGGEGSARPWTRDTSTIVWSSTKGMAAVAFLMLVDRGLLDLEAPVASYWPGFARAGKEGITVRTLLNHRAGLVHLPSSLRVQDLADPERTAPVLEAARPMWEPGADQGYHAISWGAFAGELFRRVAGCTLGAFLAAEVCGPLGANVRLGLALDDPAREHVVDVLPNKKRQFLRRAIPEMLLRETCEARTYKNVLRSGSVTGQAFRSGPSLGPALLFAINDPAVQVVELPWCGALASAEGLARVYTPLALGGTWKDVTLVRPETLEPVMKTQTWSERDLVLHKPIGWSQGFCKDEAHLFSPHPEAFGHSGMGGSVGFADPRERVAVGYVMNRMDWRIRSPRSVELCRTLYRVLGVG
jgi:CubicO group peptidase (beta-lactamase class C family)